MIFAFVPLVVVIWSARADEAEAVKAVERFRGRVTRDESKPGKPVVGVNLWATEVTDEDLKKLAPFKDLTTLDVSSSGYSECRVTDEGLKHLAVSFPRVGGVEVKGVDSEGGVHRWPARATPASSNSRHSG